MTEEQEQDYVTLQQAADQAGIKRATVYNYVNDLGIKTWKFGRDRRAYVTQADAKRLKEYKEKPWLFKVKTRDDRPKVLIEA